MSILNELKQEFADVDAAILDVLLESTAGAITEDLLSGLAELLPGQKLVLCKVLPSGQLEVPNSIDFGTRILFVSEFDQPGDDAPIDQNEIEEKTDDQEEITPITDNSPRVPQATDCLQRVCITDPGGSQTLRCGCFRFVQFGVYELEVFREGCTDVGSLPVPVLCVTETFKLAQDISALLEEVHWGWTGDWTPELEAALLELLVTASEDLRALAGQVGPLMRLFGLEDMDDTVAEVHPRPNRETQH
jgi:hypothetical protein